jgi:hypothetical protein
MSRFYNTPERADVRLKSMKSIRKKGSMIMKTKAHATFAMISWDEKPYIEMENGAKMTKTTVMYTYAGDIEGESHLEYLMAYNEGGETGTDVGLERIVGSLGGKKGSFVIQHNGEFDKLAVREKWFVVPGSATGELKGLRAEGTIDLSGHMERYPTDFEYEFIEEPQPTEEK